MDRLLLEEDSCIDDLRPFTSTRSVLDIRMGIFTLREKWERMLGKDGFALVAGGTPGALPANMLPTPQLLAAIDKLGRGARDSVGEAVREIEARIIRYPWDIFRYNAEALISDFFNLVAASRNSQAIPASVQVINPENIFIEEGARLQHCLLNASTGPIYIGRNAEIMEGSLIRGPFAACEGSIVKMGTKIYGATTLGPYSLAGGEIKNAVFFGYSSKGHDGYLGDAVIGEWCNLGAGTSASNLKNNAGDIKVWHPASGRTISAGQKCGLLMGDYSRSAINTAFNTGTVVGVCCSIFGEAPPPKYVPNFSWGSGHRYEWDKALRDIDNWKKLKNQSLTDTEILTLKHIFGVL
ncbi:MAG TPA: putative sugar nucleotidyl transferase [Puia sp.]|jgi:UDP-N-acetylglucosamine diphosphorylase/glucosamine-1-phosphate N-acetyltransferase